MASANSIWRYLGQNQPALQKKKLDDPVPLVSPDVPTDGGGKALLTSIFNKQSSEPLTPSDSTQMPAITPRPTQPAPWNPSLGTPPSPTASTTGPISENGSEMSGLNPNLPPLNVQNLESPNVAPPPNPTQNLLQGGYIKPYSTNDPRSAREQLEAAQADPTINRQPSFWKRLGSGVLTGLQNWNTAGQPGGLAGLAGAAAGGATYGAASPSWLGGQQRQQQINQLWNRYGQQLQQQQAENQVAKSGLDLQKEQVGVATDAEKYRQLLADPYLKSLDPNVITPAQAAYAWNTYRIDLNSKDTRQMITMYKDGKPWSGYTSGTGAGNFNRNPTLPTIRSQQDTAVNVPGQGTYYAPSGDALKTAATTVQEQAQRDQSNNQFKARMQFEADKANADNFQQWASQNLQLTKQQLEQQGIVIAGNAALQGKYSQMEEAQRRMQQYGDQLLNGSEPDENGTRAPLVGDQRDKVQKEFDKAGKDFATAHSALGAELGKTQAGQNAWQAISGQTVPMPPKVTFHPTQSVNPNNPNPNNKNPKNNNVGTQADYQKELRRIMLN